MQKQVFIIAIYFPHKKKCDWSCQKFYSFENKGKQNCILKKIELIEVQTHVFITATYCFLTKKSRLIMPNT